MTKDRLTEKSHWDNYWETYPLPAEVSYSRDNLLINEELKTFEQYLPRENLSICEIGGAPGQYLAWFNKELGYKITCLDYSKPGCEKTLENFEKLGIHGDVINRDLFGELRDLPKFDVVFSMGVIEHFEDVKPVIGKHLELLKPGGLLMLGMPNFRGINHFFLKRLAPDLLSKHNLKTMDIKTWPEFEDHFGLTTVFKNYIGGFEPMTFLMRETKNPVNNALFFTARGLNGMFHRRFAPLRRFNSSRFSGYIMGIYRKPTQ